MADTNADTNADMYADINADMNAETGAGTNADINLDPQATTAAGQRLVDCGGELLAARRTAGANLESMGSAQPWGRDELGDIFASRYAEPAGQALGNWRTAAEAIGELGSRVGQATANSLETDRITSEVIDKVQ